MYVGTQIEPRDDSDYRVWAQLEIRWSEAKRYLPETHFAWIGAFGDMSPFYYRILSPVILVEFDHQSGIMYDNDTPSRDHIHTVVRTPNGNDYGKGDCTKSPVKLTMTSGSCCTTRRARSA